MGSKLGTIKVAAARVGLTLPEYLERLANGMKRCTLCGEWKGIENFDKDSSRGDGRTAQCVLCRKAIWRRRRIDGATRVARRNGDKEQARARINHDVKLGLRPDPNMLYCALCGHKGDDRRHEYHHPLGYDVEHHYDVLPLCSVCHHKEHNHDEN